MVSEVCVVTQNVSITDSIAMEQLSFSEVSTTFHSVVPVENCHLMQQLCNTLHRIPPISVQNYCIVYLKISKISEF